MAFEPLKRSDMLVFGENPARCKITGHPYEAGSGALSHEEQTKMFVQARAAEIDRPKEGESCPYSGRPFDCSIGALPKSVQTEQFFAELPDNVKAQWFAKAEALATQTPAGTA